MQSCILDVVRRGFDRPVRELLAGAGHAVVSAHGLRDIAASRGDSHATRSITLLGICACRNVRLYEQVCERGQGIVGEGKGEGELASAISKRLDIIFGISAHSTRRLHLTGGGPLR